MSLVTCSASSTCLAITCLLLALPSDLCSQLPPRVPTPPPLMTLRPESLHLTFPLMVQIHPPNDSLSVSTVMKTLRQYAYNLIQYLVPEMCSYSFIFDLIDDVMSTFFETSRLEYTFSTSFSPSYRQLFLKSYQHPCSNPPKLSHPATSSHHFPNSCSSRKWQELSWLLPTKTHPPQSHQSQHPKRNIMGLGFSTRPSRFESWLCHHLAM